MKVLLLGGLGYIGGRLAEYLQSQGHGVEVTTRRAPSAAPAWIRASRVVQLDPNDSRALSALLPGVDAVIHLAMPDAAEAARDPPGALTAGAVTAWRIFEAVAALTPPPAVMLLSTVHVYGRNLSGTVTETTSPGPVHPYALARRFAEDVLQLFRHRARVPGLSIRLSNAFGCPAGAEMSQWSLVFNDLCRQAAAERRLVLRTPGVDSRNFVTMGDTVRALEFLAAHRAQWPADGVIHLGSPISLTIRQVAELVADRAQAVLGFRPPIEAPPPAGAPQSAAFSFSVERLAAMGFTWQNDVEREVDATLEFCAGKWGHST